MLISCLDTTRPDQWAPLYETGLGKFSNFRGLNPKGLDKHLSGL